MELDPVQHALHMLTHLILIATLWSYYKSHFTDVQTKFKQFSWSHN